MNFLRPTCFSLILLALTVAMTIFYNHRQSLESENHNRRMELLLLLKQQEDAPL